MAGQGAATMAGARMSTTKKIIATKRRQEEAVPDQRVWQCSKGHDAQLATAPVEQLCAAGAGGQAGVQLVQVVGAPSGTGAPLNLARLRQAYRGQHQAGRPKLHVCGADRHAYITGW